MEGMERIAVLLESHWPGIQMTKVDMAAMAEAFRRRDVTYEEAVDAIYGLVEDGERYQPRAPAIIQKVKQTRREKARDMADIRMLERGKEQMMDPCDIRKNAEEIITRLSKEKAIGE